MNSFSSIEITFYKLLVDEQPTSMRVSNGLLKNDFSYGMKQDSLRHSLTWVSLQQNELIGEVAFRIASKRGLDSVSVFEETATNADDTVVTTSTSFIAI